MLHPQHNLLFPRKLSLRELIPIQVFQELSFSYPLRVYPIEPPDLPPLVATNHILKVLRTKPVNQRVRCGVAGRDGDRDRSHGRPWRGWNVRVGAGMK